MSELSNKKRNLNFVELYSKYGTFVILILVFLGGCLLSPNFLSSRNLMNVIRQNSFLLILGFGATFFVYLSTRSLIVTLIVSMIVGACIGLF